MRIGIHAVMLDGPRSGATRRIECMARELARLGHEVVLYRGKECGIPWRPSIARAAAERLRLPSRIEADRLDALEWSHLPLSIPIPKDGPKVLLTVHDLRHLTIAQHSPFSRRFFARHVLHDAMARAHRVITVSQFTKNEMLRLLPVSEEKIVVIPNGADHIAAPSPMPAREQAILYVGHIEPRKNLGVLLEAFAAARKKGLPHRLRIAGAAKGDHEAMLRAKAEALGIGPAIDWLGPVAEESLPALYACAQLFVFPSVYEGFGIPILEAMQCGTPVIAARSGALPEVGADACLYADPQSVEEWARAIESVLGDASVRDRLIELGKKRAGSFRWEDAAKAFAAVLTR